MCLLSPSPSASLVECPCLGPPLPREPARRDEQWKFWPPGCPRRDFFFRFQRSQCHAHGSQYLSSAVVQFAGDASSLLILGVQQLAGKSAQGFFRPFSLANVADCTCHHNAVLSL